MLSESRAEQMTNRSTVPEGGSLSIRLLYLCASFYSPYYLVLYDNTTCGAIADAYLGLATSAKNHTRLSTYHQLPAGSSPLDRMVPAV